MTGASRSQSRSAFEGAFDAQQQSDPGRSGALGAADIHRFSVAGTIGMLAVVGAAGAYGMPEKLTAQALSAAMAKFNFKFPRDRRKPRRRGHRAAGEGRAKMPQAVAVSPVSDVAPEESAVAPETATVPVGSRAPIRRRCASLGSGVAADRRPSSRATASSCCAAIATPVARAAPHADRSADGDRGAAGGRKRAPRALTSRCRHRSRSPAPMVTASLTPRAAPPIAEERPLVSAPMVFEAPKPADAQVLTELPKTEVVVAPQPAAAEAGRGCAAARRFSRQLAAEPCRQSFRSA